MLLENIMRKNGDDNRLESVRHQRDEHRRRIEQQVAQKCADSADYECRDGIEYYRRGADDYIVKPFAMEELLARLRIWSRRTVSLEDPGELCFGDLSYRPSVRQLSGPAGKEVLPKRLAQLIELLLRNAEVPITRNVIFNRIWGPDAEVTDAVIDTYIHLTRQRLAHQQSAVKIQNSRGTGYQLSYEREL